MSLKDQLTELRAQALEAIQNSTDDQAINEARVKFLGKKGPITAVLRGMKDLSKEE